MFHYSSSPWTPCDSLTQTWPPLWRPATDFLDLISVFSDCVSLVPGQADCEWILSRTRKVHRSQEGVQCVICVNGPRKWYNMWSMSRSQEVISVYCFSWTAVKGERLNQVMILGLKWRANSHVVLFFNLKKDFGNKETFFSYIYSHSRLFLCKFNSRIHNKY